MTLEQINLLTWIDVAGDLGKRILSVDTEVLIVADVDVDDYEKILMHEGYPKPTLEMFEQEFLEYKSELIEIENNRLEAEALAEAEREAERLAEAERLEKIAIIESRIDRAMNELSDHKTMAKFLGVHVPNTAWKINNEIKPSIIVNHEDPESSDLSVLEAIELNYAAWDAEREAEENEQALNSKTKLIIDKCNSAIEYIVNKNTRLLVNMEMTEDDLDILEERFADVMAALNMRRPMKAYRILQTIDISGTVYTEEDVQGLSQILYYGE